jgi:EmrB/QacA subfamily drug resistance transporter
MARRWWTLVVVSAATFMLLLDVTIVSVVLPQIQSGLHTSFSDILWVVDAYSLALASLLLIGGSLADRYGRRRLFVVGLAIFTLSSLLCGISPTPLMLIISRSAQGLGGSIMFATSLALLAQSFTGKQRGVAFGVWGAVTGIASGLGPLFGGLIVSHVSWRGVFLINVPIGVFAIAATLWRVDESPSRGRQRLDWPGFVTLAAGLVCLIYGLIKAGETSWGNTAVIACLGAAAVLLVAFLLVESRRSDPLFDLKLFRTPTFFGGSIAAFTMNGSLFAMLIYLVLYLQNAQGLSPLAASVRLLLISASSLVVSIIAGRLTNRVPVRWLIGPGLALVGTGLLLMAGNADTDTWTHLIPGFVVAGIGSGFVNPPLASTAVGVVPPERSGTAAGINTTFRQVGMATSIALFGALFTASLHDGISRNLSRVPELAGRAPGLAAAAGQANAAAVTAGVPAQLKDQVLAAVHAGYVDALNELLVVASIVAFVGAVCSLALIRGKDFAAVRPGPAEAEPSSREVRA